MELNLAGKTALVTGSSRGIGLSIARVLHSEGCRVAINGRNEIDLGMATSQLSGAVSFPGDVTRPIEAQRVVKDVVNTFGKLDIVICNVGSGRSVPPGMETADEWQRVFSLNLWSTTNIVEAARTSLAASRGVIVCVSSICGLEVIPGAPITYSTAKAALHAYVRGIARPLGHEGVRINAVAPGNILFDGSIWSRKIIEDEQSVESMLKSNVALGCLGSPEDVANAVCYLASPISAFASGAIWTLDGGQVHS
ncbi:SDR family oxidoreductase [Planktomarina temperata]|nr:SDR family oxidoreductase [Planktomarina temperata]